MPPLHDSARDRFRSSRELGPGNLFPSRYSSLSASNTSMMNIKLPAKAAPPAMKH